MILKAYQTRENETRLYNEYTTKVENTQQELNRWNAIRDEANRTGDNQRSREANAAIRSLRTRLDEDLRAVAEHKRIIDYYGELDRQGRDVREVTRQEAALAREFRREEARSGDAIVRGEERTPLMMAAPRSTTGFKEYAMQRNEEARRIDTQAGGRPSNEALLMAASGYRYRVEREGETRYFRSPGRATAFATRPSSRNIDFNTTYPLFNPSGAIATQTLFGLKPQITTTTTTTPSLPAPSTPFQRFNTIKEGTTTTTTTRITPAIGRRFEQRMTTERAPVTGTGLAIGIITGETPYRYVIQPITERVPGAAIATGTVATYTRSIAERVKMSPGARLIAYGDTATRKIPAIRQLEANVPALRARADLFGAESRRYYRGALNAETSGSELNAQILGAGAAGYKGLEWYYRTVATGSNVFARRPVSTQVAVAATVYSPAASEAVYAKALQLQRPAVYEGAMTVNRANVIATNVAAPVRSLAPAVSFGGVIDEYRRVNTPFGMTGEERAAYEERTRQTKVLGQSVILAENLANIYGGQAVTSTLHRLPSGASWWERAKTSGRTIALYGGTTEGAIQTVIVQKAYGRPYNPIEIAGGAAFGGLTSSVFGGIYGATRGRSFAQRGIRGATSTTVNLIDLPELPGDIYTSRYGVSERWGVRLMNVPRARTFGTMTSPSPMRTTTTTLSPSVINPSRVSITTMLPAPTIVSTPVLAPLRSIMMPSSRPSYAGLPTRSPSRPSTLVPSFASSLLPTTTTSRSPLPMVSFGPMSSTVPESTPTASPVGAPVPPFTPVPTSDKWFFPFPLFPGGRGSGKGAGGARRGYRYTPGLRALFSDYKGGSPVGKSFTGLEVRPLLTKK